VIAEGLIRHEISKVDRGVVMNLSWILQCKPTLALDRAGLPPCNVIFNEPNAAPLFTYYRFFYTAISLEMQVFFGLEKVNRARQAQVGFYKLKRRI
jgi:hypothetical protein